MIVNSYQLDVFPTPDLPSPATSGFLQNLHVTDTFALWQGDRFLTGVNPLKFVLIILMKDALVTFRF